MPVIQQFVTPELMLWASEPQGSKTVEIAEAFEQVEKTVGSVVQLGNENGSAVLKQSPWFLTARLQQLFFGESSSWHLGLLN